MPVVRPLRCLDSRVILTSLIAGIAIVVLAWIGRAQPPHSIVRIATGLGETAALVGMIVAVVRSIRAQDELEQRIHAEAFAGAALFTILVMTAWGFLARAGLPAIDWPLWCFPFVTFAWSLRVIQISRKYR